MRSSQQNRNSEGIQRLSGRSKRTAKGWQRAVSSERNTKIITKDATSPKPCNRPNHKSAPRTASQATGNHGANQADPEQQQLALLL